MNEISYNASMMAAKNGAVVNKSASATLTMTGTQMLQQTQSVTTSWGAILLGNLASVPAKLMIQNLDTTNYIELAADLAGSYKTDKLLAQDFVMRSPTGTIYARANTAACLVSVTAVDA